MEQVAETQQDTVDTAARHTREIAMAREHLLKVEARITTLCVSLDLRFEQFNDQLATLTTLIENGSSPQQQTHNHAGDVPRAHITPLPTIAHAAPTSTSVRTTTYSTFARAPSTSASTPAEQQQNPSRTIRVV